MNHPPIPISELAEHTELLKANDNLKLSQEYEVRWPKVQRLKVLLSIDFCLTVFSLHRDTRVPAFPQGKWLFISFQVFSSGLLTMLQLVVLEQLLKYQLFLATYFLLLYWQPKNSCHFQLYEISLDVLCVTHQLRNAVSSHFWLNKRSILL